MKPKSTLFNWKYIFPPLGGEPQYDPFLSEIDALIHIGANQGQERERYWRYNLEVNWIEALPDVYQQLKANVRPFRKQYCYQGLMTDENGKRYSFNVANNRGESSSIYKPKGHKEMWPYIEFNGNIELESLTLPTFLEKNHISLSERQGLLMDAQGAEYLIIKGATNILSKFKCVVAETATFEWYEGSHTLDDVVKIMQSYGFVEHSRKLTKARENIGECYDILFYRVDEL